MDLYQLLTLAKQFNEMGDAVGRQLLAVVLRDEALDEQNPNALKAAAKFLRICARHGIENAEEELDKINEYLNSLTRTGYKLD